MKYTGRLQFLQRHCQRFSRVLRGFEISIGFYQLLDRVKSIRRLTVDGNNSRNTVAVSSFRKQLISWKLDVANGEMNAISDCIPRKGGVS